MEVKKIIAALDQASFQGDQGMVLSLVHDGPEIALPLTTGLINFSVLSDRGLSIRWQARVSPKGDAYIGLNGSKLHIWTSCRTKRAQKRR